MDYRLLTWLDVLNVLLIFTVSQTLPDNATNPYIIEHPEDQFVVRNEPATLNCKAEGSPTPVITWYRNGQQVVTANENSSSHRMLLPNGQLVLLRVIYSKTSRSDIGLYYCNATNPETKFSVISRNATLDIAVIRDEFREMPQSREVAVGMEAVLNCRPPRGEPEPKVKWKRNGRLMTVGGDHRIYVDDGGSLHFRAAQKDDAASYTCVGYNIGGERESLSARLLVREKPRIIEGPQNAVVKENSDVTFECQVVGDPDPTVIWKKLGGQIPPDRSQIMSDRSLRIERVEASDEGVYVCKSENSVGHAEAEGRLTVHSVPKFVKKPQSMEVGIGRQVSFFCEVEGNPYPTLFWNKESSQMFMFPNSDHGRFSVTEDGRLVIKALELEDSGEYTCQALNIAGSAFAKATLSVRVVDSRLPPIIQHGPQNQTLPANGKAILLCSAIGNPLPAILWTRNGKILPKGDARYAIVDTGTLQISDLRRMDTGLYGCQAVSETGETSWSATISVEAPTDPAIIFNRSPQLSTFPGAPSKPSVSDITENSMLVHWKPNSNFGASVVVAYSLEYFSPDTGKGWILVSDSIREAFFTVQNLEPSTQYIFLVRARNSHGHSPPSQPSTSEKTSGSGIVMPVTFVPALDLEVVSEKLSGQIVSSPWAAALSSTALNVTWNTLRSINFIEGFYVKYRPVENSDDVGISQRQEYLIDTIHSNTAVQFILTGLQKFTWYDVSIQPFYRTVKGAASNTIRVQTLEDVPSASPVNIQARLVDNSTLHVTWGQPPANQRHGHLLGYKIYVYGNEMRLIREIQVNSSMESVSIYHLAKNSKYSVQLSAFNKMGEGTRSETVSASEQRLVNEPWFLATLIGTVGGVLWVSLCLFSLVLYRKHKAGKKMNKNGATAASDAKAQDNHQLHLVKKELPYALSHQLVTSQSARNPCACNPALMSSCCYNESLSDGEYKAGADHLSTNHTYYTLETPTPQTSSDLNTASDLGKPLFNAKGLPLISPYATAAIGNCCPDNHPGTPDGVFRPIPGVSCDERDVWGRDVDSSQYNSSFEDGINWLASGHPSTLKHPVLYLPPPPSSDPPTDASWTASKIQPPVYNLAVPSSQISKSHGKGMPSPREKTVGFAQQLPTRHVGARDAQQIPRYTTDQLQSGTRTLHHPGFQPSDYAIKPDTRRQQFPDNTTDSDNFSAGTIGAASGTGSFGPNGKNRTFLDSPLLSLSTITYSSAEDDLGTNAVPLIRGECEQGIAC